MLSRKLQDFGLNALLAYLLITVAFIALSIYLFYKTTYAQYIYPLIAVLFLMGISEKTRNEFLKNTFSKVDFLQIRMLENLFVVIPFCCFLAIKGIYMLAVLLFISALLFGLISVKTSNDLSIPTPFSRYPFEFTVGFRKSFPIIAIAYFLTVMAIIVGNFNLGLFSLILVPIVCLSFYSIPENEFFVWVHDSSPHQFLKNKMMVALLYTTILCLPIVIALCFYAPNKIHLVILIFGLGLLYVTLVLLAKYVAFPKEINLPQGFLIALSIFFPPFLLVLLPYYYLKSKHNLKVYLR
jgi:hypothetical protein